MTDEELLWEREDEPSDGLSFGQRSDSHIFGVGAGSGMGTARCWSGLTIDEICARVQKHAENYPVTRLEREWLLSDETSQSGLATLKDWTLAETRLLRTQAEELMSWRRMGWCLDPVFGHNLLDIVRDIECSGKPVKIKSMPDGDGFGTGHFRDPAMTKRDEGAMDILTRSRLGRYRMQWVLERVEALFVHFLLLWDFINVSEFHRTDLFTRLKYVFRYILLFKSIAVMGLDIFTAITMISSDHWTNTLTQKASADSSSGINVQFAIAKWVFVGCIIFSFLLYGYEFYKAKHVVQSRDIAYAFTNLQANDYFSFKNYDNFCLFCHIDNSTKRKDDLAFFVFFTFKDWKRLLLADGPRQSINALLLYSFGTANGWQTSDIPAWWDKDLVTAMLLFSMIATVLIFAGSLILLIAASVMYVPLLCYIQGNLKEYVCVKVDKRLAELIRKKQRQRAARAAALEKKVAKEGGLRNSRGELVNVTLQPTLPKIKLDEDEMSLKGMRGDTSRLGGMGLPRSGSRDALGAFGNTSAITLNQNADEYAYPPTLDYSSNNHLYAAGAVADREYGSTTRLTDAAGPMGISYPPLSAAAPPSAYPLPRRGSENTHGHGHGRMTPSRSQTQLSGNSNGGYSAGPSQPSYPPSAMPAYPQRQHSRAQADYPAYPATAANANAAQLAAPGVSGHGYGTEQSAGSIQPGYTGDYGYTRSTSPLSYDQFDHEQRQQAGPPQRQLTDGGRAQQYQQYHQAQPQMVPRSARAPSPSPSPSSGLAYDQPDTDYASVDGHDPAPSYHTASPPRQDRQDRRHGPTYGYGGGQGGGQGRGHGDGDLHGW